MSASESSKTGLFSNVESGRPLYVARLFFLLTGMLAVASLPGQFALAQSSGNWVGAYSPQWAVLLLTLSLLALVNLVGLALLFSPLSARFLDWLDGIRAGLARFGLLNLLGVGLFWAVYVLLVLYRYQKQFVDFRAQAWTFWLCVGLGTIFLLAGWRKLSLFQSLLVVSLLYGFGVRALGFLPDITHFPFSLGWSEGSRFYYGSLPFAPMLFGEAIPLSPWHPSRYLLLSLPFLIPNASLWFSRLWQVFLWLALPLATGLVLGRRFGLKPLALVLGAVWASLVLLEGPVYYHLLVCVIIVLWGFDRRRFWQTLVVVALSSIWAGISRINWVPVPAGLAAAMYLMETPVCEMGSLRTWRGWLAYFGRPALWGVVGCAVALAAQSAYVLVSGHEDTSGFGSSFTSALLWYRLLPNPTNALGVLPTIVLVTIPELILFAGNIVQRGRGWHALRVLLLVGLTLVLFAGGLVVSTKIGGGSNIHNMDAYIALILLIAAYIWMDRFVPESGPGLVQRAPWRPWMLTLLLVVIPVMWGLQIGDPFVRRDMKQATIDITKLNAEVQKRSAQGKVLFITQRHLQVYRLTPDHQPYPDYELLTLSEMAISNNQPYLSRFYDDLKNHRFSLIVADRQSSMIKDPRFDAFAEENNAWVTHISRYLMQYYKSKLFLETQGIDLLVPR